VFIKRNRTQFGGKGYQSILLVQGKRVPAKRAPGRPAAGAPPPRSVVVHETLANLSKLPPELIELIDRHCKHQPQPAEVSHPPVGGTDVAAAIHMGPCYGVLGCLDGLAREVGFWSRLWASKAALSVWPCS
jgi:hypothetical protein